MHGRYPDTADAAEALVDLLAEKIAAAMAEKQPAPIITEHTETVVESPEQVMNARHTAEFLGVSYEAFRRMAPELPRCKLSAGRYVYLKSDLIAYLEAKREAPAWFHRQMR